MKAIQKRLGENIKSLDELKDIYSTKDGWIVESKNHVNVGNGNGLNGTSFAVKSPMASKNAIVWETKELAEKYGADYYLVDGNNKPIQMIFTKAYDFFSREVETYKELLIFIQKNNM